MYSYLDRPVETLGSGSRFVLRAMRGWVRAGQAGRCPRIAVAGSFITVGAAAALADFHEGMARLAAAPGKKILLAHMACRRISEGEAVLLALWADLAGQRHDNALAVLRLMVPSATADLLLESLAGAADHLGHAGLAPDGLLEPCGMPRAGDGDE